MIRIRACGKLGAGQNATGKFMPQGTSAGFGKDGDSASSTTLAAISGIAGNTSARTGDPESGIGKIFDQEKVQKEIDAQVRITQVFGQLAPKAAADFAGKQAEELRKQGNVEEARKWEEGGVYRIALHTALGGLAGGTSGALGAGASAAAAPLLNELQDSIVEHLQNAGASDTVAKLTGQLISGATAAGIGAAAGGTQGATTAFNTDANNRQLHPEEKKLIKSLAAQKAKDACQGDTSCQNKATLYWTDALERVAEASADDQAYLRTANYLNAQEHTASIPGSEG